MCNEYIPTWKQVVSINYIFNIKAYGPLKPKPFSVTTVGEIDCAYTCANVHIHTHTKHNDVSYLDHYFIIVICDNTSFCLFDKSLFCWFQFFV